MKHKDINQNYLYGFNDGNIDISNFESGINVEIIKKISKFKNEDEWMLNFRLKSFEYFCNKPNPGWGPNLDFIDYDQYTYFVSGSKQNTNDWNQVPDKIKNTFEKLGIKEAEAKFLNGVGTQYDSTMVYHSINKELNELGVIFLDTDTAYKKHPELFKKYFNKIVSYTDNKFAALNSAVWSGGTFIYVPKGVSVPKPLQSYFRINAQKSGQFERTLIIVDDEASLHYIEGCTAPIYSNNNLHAAVVEIYVGKNANCRYTTIQNWSDNIINLVTKRAIVDTGGNMSWIDGNIGSMINMKYPCCILKGNDSKGECISIAVAKNGVIQDAGAKMIHIGKNSKSRIISKAISFNNGKNIFRGLVKINSNADNSNAIVECDTLLVDKNSESDTYPLEIMNNNSSFINHEASISKISDDQLFYLMSKGISKEKAKQLIIFGFLEKFSSELPMEYAVELNQLLNLDMEGSIG